MDKYIGKTMSGKEFIYLFPDISEKLVKLTNREENHNGYIFKTGLNVDTNKFDADKKCGNGIYFTDIYNMIQWFTYKRITVTKFLNIFRWENEYDDMMIFYRKVTLPLDCNVCIESRDKFKADKIILGDRIKIKDMDIWKDEEYCIRAINQNESAFRYIREPSVSLQILFVKNKGSNIRYIKDPNEDVQIEALKQNPCLITHIEQPCRLAQLIAVSYNGFLIKHIKNTEITEEVQLEAVKQNGKCIEYIRDPSENVKVAADYGISGF